MKKYGFFFRAGAVCLALGVMLTGTSGCGKSAKHEEDIPELIESTVTNEDSRPVVRGNIGKLTFIMTRAVPRGYSQCFDVGRTVQKVFVKVGQYVEKGDKIAQADTADLDNQIESIKKSREGLDKQIESAESEYSRTIDGLIYDRDALRAKGDNEGADELDKTILMTKENHEYQREQFSQQKDAYDRDIADIEKQKDELTLYATHSGYITYLMNVGYYNYRQAYENVAYISDYDDIYLEAAAMNIKTFSKYRKSPRIYAVVEGKEYAVTEDAYSTAATLYAANEGKFPMARFKLEGYTPSIGETVPVYAYENYYENVLMVGNDSIRYDGAKKYVFVEGSTGGMEKREIETGVSDDVHTEVVSGLSEGDKVFYLSDSIKPIDYEEISIEPTDFSAYNISDIYQYITTDVKNYSSPESGRIYEILAEDNAEVKEGDPLFSVKVEISDARLLEAEQSYRYAKEQYENTINGLYKEIERIDGEIEKLDNAEPPAATDTDAIRDNQAMRERLIFSREQTLRAIEDTKDSYSSSIGEVEKNYLYLKKLKDNDGIVTVYSDDDGILHYRGYQYPGVDVQKGLVIASIDCGEKDYIVVSSMKGKNAGEWCDVAPGTRIIFRGEKNYTGECLAVLGTDVYQTSKHILEELDGKIFIAANGSSPYGNIESGYFVKMDDESFKEETEHFHVAYEAIGLKKAVVIPVSCIYPEKNDVGRVVRYFVWLKEDGQLTKRYVDYFPSFVTGDQALIPNGLSFGDVIVKDRKAGGR